MKKRVYVASAFTKEGKGGNLAGVVLDSSGLFKSDMLSISKKLGYSETAFLLPSETADFEVRFFTPELEVDICGHATIATFAALAQNSNLKPGTYTIKTQAGILQVQIEEGGRVHLQQTAPDYLDILAPEEIVESLCITENTLLPELPIQIVSTGLRDIVIPIKSLKALQGIEPNFEKIIEVSKKYNTIGYHLFTLETLHLQSIAHSRNFAPLYGITEESATGTSNAALAAYLVKYEKINKAEQLLPFEQGYVMNQPSEIIVKVDRSEEAITNVMVGGYATILEEKEVRI